jgi:hypothetical protein
VVRDEYAVRKPRPPELFKWQPKFDRINATAVNTCRNSVQGKKLLADERGTELTFDKLFTFNLLII